MTAFLDAKQLSEDSRDLRLATAVLSALPMILLFGAAAFWKGARKAGEGIGGRPPGQFFGFVWFVIAALWLFAALVAAFYMEAQWLQGFLALHIAAAFIVTAWVPVYATMGASKSMYVFGFALLVAILMLLLMLSAPLTNPPEEDQALEDQARIALLCSWAPLLAWVLYAMGLNLMDANQKTSYATYT